MIGESVGIIGDCGGGDGCLLLMEAVLVLVAGMAKIVLVLL